MYTGCEMNDVAWWWRCRSHHRRWFGCTATPAFPTFWAKTSWDALTASKCVPPPKSSTLQKCTIPTSSLPLLDPIELYLNSKRLLLKGDTGIFSIFSFSHQHTRIWHFIEDYILSSPNTLSHYFMQILARSKTPGTGWTFKDMVLPFGI